MRRVLGSRLVIATVAIAAAGCAGGAAPSPAGRTAAPLSPSPTPAPGLLGTWATTLTGHERFQGPTIRLPDGAPPAGTWKVTFAASQATIYNPQAGDSFPLGSSFNYTATTMTFGPDSNCMNLDPPTAATGVYTYQLNGTAMTLHLVSDGCLGRAATLTTHPWQKL